jgi:uncharacterized protein (TIGR02231 family)
VQQFLRAAVLYCLTAPALFAQTSTPSRIDHVTLYAGAADVTRAATASAGSSYLLFDCIPKTFLTESVRATASSSSRIGDIRIDALSPARAKACRHSPEEDRVRALEDQQAAATAEKDANEQVADYIKARSAAAEKQNAPDAKSFAAFIEGLRQTAQATFLKRQALDRKLEDLDVELKTARQERDRVIGDAEEFVAIRVAVQAKASDEVHLTYSTTRAGWGATYRASLDSASGTVILERNALVAQNTGEPWVNVQLSLSTGQPARSSASGPLPYPRTLGYVPPAPPEGAVTARAYAPMPVMLAPPAPAAPAPAPPPNLSRAKAETPLFDVNAFLGTYATSFDLSGPVTLPADGQKVTLSLGTQSMSVHVVAQSVPQSGDTGAYITAHADPLPGIWPRGNLQLVRDGASVAMLNNWQAQSNEPFSLSFGRDELVIVSVDPSINTSAGSGFFGDSVRRELHAHYTVTNRHTMPVNVEILESSPVSTNDKVKVETHFSPAVSVTDWDKKPGVIAWDARLDAGATAEYRADYTVTAPKEGTVTGL